MKLITILFPLTLLSTTYSQDERIINGFDVEPEFAYPWMVAIYRYGEYFCGGALLRDNMVITAAHCAGGLIAPLDFFEVQVHRHNLTRSLEEENAKSYKVLSKWVPKDFNRDTLYNDIAIMKLDVPSNKSTSLVLDKKLNHRPGQRVTALGWGATKLLGANTDVLQEVWLPLASDVQCKTVYKQQLNYTIMKTQICAGYRKGGKDTCQGDSGGPLFKYVNDKPVLVGIISNGISCAQPNTPAVYTRIARFYKWINNILNGKIPPNVIPE